MTATTAKTIREGSLPRRLLALVLALAAAVAISIAVAPAAALADEAVSFGGADIAAGHQVYLGEWENAPIAWDVESASSGSIDVHSTCILFVSALNRSAEYVNCPDLTLNTSDLYTKTYEIGSIKPLPMFKNQAFSDGESALPGDFALSGDFGAATFPDGKPDAYWINANINRYGDFWMGVFFYDGIEEEQRVHHECGVRPASAFDLTPVLFSSAAEGGKSADARSFSELSDASSVSAWKFTLTDPSRTISASATGTTAAEGYSSWTVPVTFEGGGEGADDYVSAILCDANGSALYYGTVAKAAASGTQDMAMPTGLVEGAYTLKVFSEQRNGDKATDYAGAFKEITLTVEAAPEITITAASDSKVYDGTELTKNSYKLTSGSLANGDAIESVTVKGSQTVVGEGSNVPSDAVIRNGAGEDVTGNYNITYVNGKLKVTQASLTITAKDQTYQFDGEKHGPGDAAYENPDEIKELVDVEGLAPGDRVASIIVDGQGGPAIGTYKKALVPGNTVIKNNDNEDVTSSYKISTVPGNVRITNEHNVTVTIDPAESGVVTGAGAYEQDETVSLSATPKTGYFFESWKSDDVSIADPTKTTVSFKMPGKAVTVTANFKEKAKIDVMVNKDGVPQDGLADYLYLEKEDGSKLGVVFAYSNEEQKYIYDPATTKGEQLATGDYILRFDPSASSGYTASSAKISYYEEVYQESITFDYYTVEFVNYDNTVLQSGAYKAGEQPKYDGDEPTKPATAQCEYTFSGWDPGVVPVEDMATYTATFTEAAREYTVEFVNWDGTVLQSGKVAYGEQPKYMGDEPTRPATAEYTYAFKGWEPEIVAVTGDATYTAAFTEVAKKGVYKVVSGEGSTWTEGSSEPLVFVFKRTVDDETSFDHFAGILMDGKAVPEKDASGRVNYTAEKGSVVVSLQPAYVATLPEGEHTLTALFNDGNNVDASFTVAAKDNPAPKPDDNKSSSSAKTGDTNGGLIIGLSVAALVALCVIMACVVRSRKAKGRHSR